MKREVRIRLLPDCFVGGKWTHLEQPLVRLGDVGVWSMVRRADFPTACPFVISRKQWDKLALASGMEAGTGETREAGLDPEGDARKDRP